MWKEAPTVGLNSHRNNVKNDLDYLGTTAPHLIEPIFFGGLLVRLKKINRFDDYSTMNDVTFLIDFSSNFLFLVRFAPIASS